jgi:hypothetical protein
MVMHRPLRPAAVLVASLALCGAPAAADAPEAIDRARAMLSRNDARGAVAALEEALPTVTPDDRRGLLDLLRESYEAAVRQAEADGRPGDAEAYRDNLDILGRLPRARDAAPADPPTRRASAVVEARPPAVEARPPAAAPSLSPPSRGPEVALPIVPSAVSANAPVAEVEAATAPPPVPPASPMPPPAPYRVEVADADAAFAAKQYGEAGRLYAVLDKEARLPKERRDHWAYCRWVDVVRRINARPTSAQEWASIDAEIEKIRALSPNNWYGEYLRNRASERTASRRTARSGRFVVRGAAPEEPSATAPAPKPTAPPRAPAPKAPSPAPSAPPEAVRASTTGQWQVHETANFRILHDDPELADRVSRVAEEARDAQVRRWTGAAPRGDWSPRCDIYIYPTAKVFAKMTGQREDSPGFSTMGLNAGQIIARRINLRADHPNLVAAVLPHEITHVVLADLFPHQQIPRWADEGIAVLSEPSSEQRLRALDLDDPLAKGRLFKLGDLMAMDYPDGKFWGLYYAQSVSLTRFLVEQGTPSQFIEFVRGCQRDGPEAELRRLYKIDGLADLNRRWLSYAKAKSAEMTATASNTEEKPTRR